MEEAEATEGAEFHEEAEADIQAEDRMTFPERRKRSRGY